MFSPIPAAAAAQSSHFVQSMHVDAAGLSIPLNVHVHVNVHVHKDSSIEVSQGGALGAISGIAHGTDCSKCALFVQQLLAHIQEAHPHPHRPLSTQTAVDTVRNPSVLSLPQTASSMSLSPILSPPSLTTRAIGLLSPGDLLTPTVDSRVLLSGQSREEDAMEDVRGESAAASSSSSISSSSTPSLLSLTPSLSAMNILSLRDVPDPKLVERHSLKRRHEAEAAEEEPILEEEKEEKKSDEISSDSNKKMRPATPPQELQGDESKWYETEAEFYESFHNISKIADFKGRIDTFRNQVLSPARNKANEIVEYIAWITTDKKARYGRNVYYKVVLKEEPYTSRAIDVTAFGKDFEQKTQFYFHVYECIGEDSRNVSRSPILTIRASEENGEIADIDASAKLTKSTGNQITHLGNKIVKALNIKMFMFDAAKKTIAIARKSPWKEYVNDPYLKAFVMGDPEGKTWYERRFPGMRPADCNNWKMSPICEENSLINQSAKAYRQALLEAETYPLSHISELCDSQIDVPDDASKKLIEMVNGVFGAANEPFDITKTDKTIKDLIGRVIQKAKDASISDSEREEVSDNQLHIYHRLLVPPSVLKKTASANAKKWWNAIDVLASTSVWVMDPV